MPLTDLHPNVRAEKVPRRANQGKVGVSLATFSNALNQLYEPGLSRILTVDASHGYFDADTSDHHHLVRRGREADCDVPSSAIGVEGLPEWPEGTQITHADWFFG
ncbi:transcriptional repressor [Mesorhizobium loti]|uniref:transcriptional repressor n=1 Tax=Rhizobium loti TaxID=381 RepID=UPI0012DB5BEB|nr:transcriptional repressor [Mesorhizobium loti]